LKRTVPAVATSTRIALSRSGEFLFSAIYYIMPPFGSLT
jgi:hypothetical protein